MTITPEYLDAQRAAYAKARDAFKLRAASQIAGYEAIIALLDQLHAEASKVGPDPEPEVEIADPVEEPGTQYSTGWDDEV